MQGLIDTNYRNDIQGLRAIAVVAVLLYHLDSSLLPGGFLGVDVFFVISGFLITRIIWRDLEAGQFTFMGFYTKRARRLLPALYAMLLACAVVAFLFSLPQELERTANSIAATVLYVSNFFFWSENNYFAVDLKLSPLLHTWSLSVEEQFYLFFPLLLVILRKSLSKSPLLLLVLLAIAGVIIAEIALKYRPSAAFYLLPFRAFEFLFGAIVVFLPAMKRIHRVGILCFVFSAFILLLYSQYGLTSSVSMPGYASLLPVLATALLIYLHQYHQTPVRVLLESPPMQWLGKVSYSLYLWHWPIIVYYRTLLNPSDQLGIIEVIFLAAASLLAAALSWHFIERPTQRLQNNKANVRLYLGMGIASVAFIATAVFVQQQQGLKQRYSVEQQKIMSYLDYDRSRERAGECFLTSDVPYLNLFNEASCLPNEVDKSNRVLLLGDSHAAHLLSGLLDVFSDASISQANGSGCKPFISFKGAWYCVALNKKMYEEQIRKGSFDTIVLSAYWKEADVSELRETLEELGKYVKRVVVLGPVLTYDQALPKLLVRFTEEGVEDKRLVAARNYKEVQGVDSQIREMMKAATPKSEYYSLLSVICPNYTASSSCVTLATGSVPLQWDYGHLTHEGAVYVLRKLQLQGLSL